MDDELGAAAGLAPVAQALRAAHAGRRADPDRVPVLRGHHEPFCRHVARHFEKAPDLHWTPWVAERYRRYARENLVQYRAARSAGIEVRPWTGAGPPYRDSRELIGRVRATGVLHVHLTRDGHGPDDRHGFHPLRLRAGVVEHGVELVHNDVLRAVHDLYGHVLHGHGFGPRGELTVAHRHAQLYPPDVRAVLFTEHVGQICWYFYGPHSRHDGPGPRPYPRQKVFLFPPRHLTRLGRLFDEE